jgi:hypothetical protein
MRSSVAVCLLFAASFCCSRTAQCLEDESFLFRMLKDIPYEQLLMNSDKKFQLNTGIPMTSTFFYHNYSMFEIVKFFNKSMLSRSFVDRGNFDHLLQKLSNKLYQLNKSTSKESDDSKNTKVIPLHLLFVGGSVCSGHHTYTHNTSNESSVTTAEHTARASAHLSWPRRLTTLLTYALARFARDISPLQEQGIRLQVSPRYCCRPATSTTHAVDILKSRQYSLGRCSRDYIDMHQVSLSSSHNNTTPFERAQPWEPDLVLWDYSVNDMNNNWFLSRPREYVYENFVRMTLKAHAAQIVDFEFINHLAPSPHKKIAFHQREAINHYYGVPMVDYMTALGSNSSDLHESTPLYAEKLSNRHPAWPTHVVWAQLALGVVMSGLTQWKGYFERWSTPPRNDLSASSQLITPPFVANYSLLPVFNRPPDDHNEYLGICNNHSYSSFYDFDDIKDGADMSFLRSEPGITPVKVFQVTATTTRRIIFVCVCVCVQPGSLMIQCMHACIYMCVIIFICPCRSLATGSSAATGLWTPPRPAGCTANTPTRPCVPCPPSPT